MSECVLATDAKKSMYVIELGIHRVITTLPAIGHIFEVISEAIVDISLQLDILHRR